MAQLGTVANYRGIGRQTDPIKPTLNIGSTAWSTTAASATTVAGTATTVAASISMGYTNQGQVKLDDFLYEVHGYLYMTFNATSVTGAGTYTASFTPSVAVWPTPLQQKTYRAAADGLLAAADTFAVDVTLATTGVIAFNVDRLPLCGAGQVFKVGFPVIYLAATKI